VGVVDVLGVWAMNDERNPKKRYIGQIYTTLRNYREWIDSDTVVIGDFNWNVIWDESPDGPLRGDFSDTVGIMNDCGLRSAYYSVAGSDFGDEDVPTFYIFAPDDVVDSVSKFTIGEYDDWIDASDHMPVIMELEM